MVIDLKQSLDIEEQIKKYLAERQKDIERKRKNSYEGQKKSWAKKIKELKENLVAAREKLEEKKAYRDFSSLSQAEIEQFVEDGVNEIVDLFSWIMEDASPEEKESAQLKVDEEIKTLRQMNREELEKYYKDFQAGSIKAQENFIKELEDNIEREERELKEFSLEDIKVNITNSNKNGVVVALMREDIVDEKLDKAYNICQALAKENINFQVVVLDRSTNKNDYVAYNYSAEQTKKLARFNEKIKPLNGQLLFNEFHGDASNADDLTNRFFSKKERESRKIEKLTNINKETALSIMNGDTSQFNGLWTFEQVVKANEEIDKLVKSIKDANLSPYEAMTFIHKYITDNYYYKNTDSIESSRTITGAVLYKEIVCVGYASMVKAIVDKLDMPNLKCDYLSCRFRMKDLSGLGAHMQNLVAIKDDKYGIDGVYVEDACFDSARTIDDSGSKVALGFGNFLFSVNDVENYKDYNYFQDDRKTSIGVDFGMDGYTGTPEIIKKYGDKSQPIGEDKLEGAVFEVFTRMPQYYADKVAAEDISSEELANFIHDKITFEMQKTKIWKESMFLPREKEEEENKGLE